MNEIWLWVAGFLVTMIPITLVRYGSPGRQARYRVLGVYGRHLATVESRTDAAAQRASMRHMLVMRGRK